MRVTRFLWTGAVCLLAVPALAQPPVDEGGSRPAPDPAMKQKLLDTFDTNHDGTIDPTERRAIRRALAENFGGPPAAGGPDGRRGRGSADRGPGDRGPDAPPPPRRRPDGPPPPRDRGPDGRRGPGPGGPGGPPPGPNPERLFNVFDENADGSLSKEEFLKLSEFMRSLRLHGPQAMRRDGRREFDGPPRGDFDRRGERGPRGEGRPRPPRGPDGPPGPPPPDADDSI